MTSAIFRPSAVQSRVLPLTKDTVDPKMDVQAILDATEGSIDGRSQEASDSSHVDIERILLEDDEVEYGMETRNDNIPTTASLSTISTMGNYWSKKSLGPRYDVVGNGFADSNNHPVRPSCEPGPSSELSPKASYSNTGAHNPEDWAVLQQILGEEDDDDEDAMWIDASVGHKKTPETRGAVDVDTILNAIGSDDEEDIQETFRVSAAMKQLSPPRPLIYGRQQESPRDLPDLGPLDDKFPTSPSTNVLVTIEESTKEERQVVLPENTQLSAVSQRVNTFDSVKRHELPSRHTDEEATAEAIAAAEAYERRLLKPGHREIVSPLMVKRRLKPYIELGTAMQKKEKEAAPSGHSKPPQHSSTAQAQRFGFSGVMEMRTMPSLSAKIREVSTQMKGEAGLPTALAVNSKFIAIGTQKGLIVVFDLFEVQRQTLGRKGSDMSSTNPETGAIETQRQKGAVSSLDISMNGDALIAGYTSGSIVLWDIIKGVVLRNVSDTHPSPISTVRFLTEKDLKAVTVDAGGLVNKLTFSKTLLWSAYSMETECLLDGTAGQILAMNVLPSLGVAGAKQTRPGQTLSPLVHRLILIGLSSERSSFAVAVEPAINVLHKWPKPELEAIQPANAQASNVAYLPCLSWGWALVAGGENVVTPILARSWGCCVQFLQANLPTIESGPIDRIPWPSFGLHDEFRVPSPVVALDWLSERALVYLTITNEFTIVDTVMMTMLERLDFSGLRLVYAEFSLSRKAAADIAVEQSQNPGTMLCTTFQNSFRASDERLLVLCQEEVKTISILGAKRRISALEEDGEWLEALALALDHYESAIESQADRRRESRAKRQLPPDAAAAESRSEDEEWIAKLLIRYFNLAVDNAPTTDMENSMSPSTGRYDLAKSHFQMLAGVCIEFCISVRRLDLLFGPIFRRFLDVGYASVFLDVLEPYVLNDKLSYVAPEAMAHFVEHCKATNGIATVERCLLHMDVTMMDFDSVIALLRRNDMFSALFHVFSHGLDDFVTPLEMLLERLFDTADEGQPVVRREKENLSDNPFVHFGYKAIIYLRHCFEGTSFPQGTPLEQEGKTDSIRPQLLSFLCQEKHRPSGNFRSSLAIEPHFSAIDHRSLPYPYIHILLVVDPRAMLDALSVALDAPDSAFGRSNSAFESIGGWEVEVAAELPDSPNDEPPQNGSGQQSAGCPDKQDIITILSSIILPDDDQKGLRVDDLSKSKTAVDAFLDFMAKYLLRGIVRANKTVVFQILSRMVERFSSTNLQGARNAAQKQILEMLTALPRNAYDPEEVLNLISRAGVHRAALLLHQQGASAWHEGNQSEDRRSQHFVAAIDCFLDDEDPEFRTEVFDYVKKECTGAGGADDAESLGLRSSLLSKLADLVKLEPILAAQLVAELYIDELDDIVSLLANRSGERAQFSFLNAVISGNLAKVDVVAGSVLSSNLTMSHHQVYLSLMAKLHPDMVYQYLSTHDNYRMDECLKLCQKYEIADASAYLLEKMGNVSSALQLILQTLEGRMMGLKRTIRGVGTDLLVGSASLQYRSDWSMRRTNSAIEAHVKQGKEVQGVKRILVVALDLCERNSGAGSKHPQQGSQLWFNVLDRLINAKGFLRLAKEQENHANMMARVLSDLLQLTMQRMVSSVPLSDLVRKVTTENSGSRLGELREMIEVLLRTYGHELEVCSSAVAVMHSDIKGMENDRFAMKVSS